MYFRSLFCIFAVLVSNSVSAEQSLVERFKSYFSVTAFSEEDLEKELNSKLFAFTRTTTTTVEIQNCAIQIESKFNKKCSGLGATNHQVPNSVSVLISMKDIAWIDEPMDHVPGPNGYYRFNFNNDVVVHNIEALAVMAGLEYDASDGVASGDDPSRTLTMQSRAVEDYFRLHGVKSTRSITFCSGISSIDVRPHSIAISVLNSSSEQLTRALNAYLRQCNLSD